MTTPYRPLSFSGNRYGVVIVGVMVKSKNAVVVLASLAFLAACADNSAPSGGSLVTVGTGPSASTQVTSSVSTQVASAPTTTPLSRDDAVWVQSWYPDCSGGLCAVFERAAPEGKITIVAGSGAITPGDGFEACGLVRGQDDYCRRISGSEEVAWPLTADFYYSAQGKGVSQQDLARFIEELDFDTAGLTPKPAALLDFDELPGDEPRTLPLRIHCGAGVLSTQLNGRWWRTEEANSEPNWLPNEWRDAGAVEQIDVVVQVNTTRDRLEVSYAGRTVVYTPTELTDEDYCD